MKRLLSVALMVLVSLVGMVGFSRAGNEVSALQASANATNEAVGGLDKALVDIPGNVGVAAARAKMYYLTRNIFDGGDAIKACDPRFHMASLFELQGNTELQYATSLSSAYVSANDEVSGTHIRPGDGWARPVFSAALPADRIPDLGDCEHWTTRSLEVSGTTVQSPVPSYDPNTYYDDPITNTVRGRWLAYSETSCMANLRVWCVEDPE